MTNEEWQRCRGPVETIRGLKEVASPRKGIVDLAGAIYEDRAFGRMPILGDALEETGCSDEDILEHCRGDHLHARGCWLIDLILGRS